MLGRAMRLKARGLLSKIDVHTLYVSASMNAMKEAAHRPQMAAKKPQITAKRPQMATNRMQMAANKTQNGSKRTAT